MMISTSKKLGMKLLNLVCEGKQKRFSESSSYSVNARLALVPGRLTIRKELNYTGFVGN